VGGGGGGGGIGFMTKSGFQIILVFSFFVKLVARICNPTGSCACLHIYLTRTQRRPEWDGEQIPALANVLLGGTELPRMSINLHSRSNEQERERRRQSFGG